ncbi:polysaccharide pyruvyl transferase family protein [Chitinophaga sp. CF418]|uniref:polysaccharide pyruvyl transferase family protein n=1 Tax=Chitinophaga sp. CF418 TaxID=1855287 RepID=UPI000910F5D0|nr:polysaccharide pyruvyl transferase family protein [Chitinophaga sp. CF418]SHM79809.1 hypothetical protein SAMN05216311_103273 [Chitinophaga sp. CF418]
MNYYYQVEGLLRNNIGDVLQGMVAKDLLPEGAKVADREALADLASNEKGMLIANGWYMHSFKKFPAPDNITPVYAAVHIANSALLADAGVREHFRKHAPIGCRDTKTLRLLLGWGIPAYYSSCLTITAKARGPVTHNPDGDVLLVDNVDHPVPDAVFNKLEELLGKKPVRISHDPPDTSGDIESYAKVSEKHMDHLLSLYCKASMVLTTKIHCALPGLGMGANVKLIHPNPSDPRLATVAEFIDIISYKEILERKDLNTSPVNKEALEKRRQFLLELVADSIKEGANAVQASGKMKYRLIRMKAALMAKLYRMSVVLSYRVGFAKDKIERVYGAGF